MPSSRPLSPALGAVVRLIALGLPLALGLTLAAHTLADLDIWLHDRVGGDILATGRLPHSNGFSFTAPDQPWTDHEWLFQVLVTAVGGTGGPEQHAAAWGRLRMALLALLALAFWLEGAAPGPRRRWPSPARAAALALPATVALALLWIRIEVRPELLSLLAMIATMRCIDAALASPASPAAMSAGRWAAWRPLCSLRSPAGRGFWLTVAWAQCHGFWLLSPLLWLLAVLLQPLDRRLAALPGARRDRATAPSASPSCFGSPLGRLGPAAACFVAGALTPNHIQGLLYPFQALSQLGGGGGVDLHQLIAEMAPLSSLQNRLGLTLLVFQAGLAWSLLWMVATAGRVPLLRLVLLAAGFALALSSQRNLTFCAGAFYLAHAGCDPSRRWLWARWPAAAAAWRTAGRVTPIVGLVGAAVVCGLWIPRLLDDRFYLGEGVKCRAGLGLSAAQYPFAAADRLKADGGARPARVACNIDAASTLVNRRAGLVFIDGRTEAYPAAVWSEYLGLRGGGPGALALLQRRGVDAVVLVHANPGTQKLVDTLLGSSRWQIEAADDAGLLMRPAAVAPGAPDSAAAAVVRARNAEVLRAAQRRLLDGLPATGGGALDADRCLALANLLKRAGLDAESEQTARRGLASRPDHPLLNHNAGNLLLARGEPAAAAARFRAALQASPWLVDARLNLGVALFQTGAIGDAAREFRRATRDAPRRVEAWADLGEALQRLGDRDGAREAYRRAVRLRPDDAGLRRRAAAAGA